MLYSVSYLLRRILTRNLYIDRNSTMQIVNNLMALVLQFFAPFTALLSSLLNTVFGVFGGLLA